MSDKQIGALFAEVRDLRNRMDSIDAVLAHVTMERTAPRARADAQNASFEVHGGGGGGRASLFECAFDATEKDAYEKIMRDNIQLTMDKWRLEDALKNVEVVAATLRVRAKEDNRAFVSAYISRKMDEILAIVTRSKK